MQRVSPLRQYEEQIRQMALKMSFSEVVEAFSHLASRGAINSFLHRYGIQCRGIPSNRNHFLEERIDEIRELAAKGKSANDIARHFGGQVTRNAVIGFCRRRGIRLGKGFVLPKLKGRPPPKPKPKHADPIVKKLEYIPSIPANGGITLEELTPERCHHPLWRVEEIGERRYCGRPVLFGTSYCPSCYNHVYEPLL